MLCETKQVGIDMTGISTRPLVAGTACGRLLRLSADISFWGGVDPCSGRIIDTRHPQHDECMAGKILLMNRSIGSSSGSSVLLELFQRKLAPAGIILAEPDFIIVLGVLVAKEMGYGEIPVIQMDPAHLETIPGRLEIDRSGALKAVK